MASSLTDWLGNDIGGTAEGPTQSGTAGVGYTGINWGDFLKHIGLSTPQQNNSFTPMGGAASTPNSGIPMYNLQAKPMGDVQKSNDTQDMQDIQQIAQLAGGMFGGGIG
jgi:hypothetical protein